MAFWRLLRVIGAVLFLVIGFALIYHANNKTYDVFPKPDESDCRKVTDADISAISHFEITNMASFDGITRHPTSEETLAWAEEYDEPDAPKPSPWSLVLKDAKSACAS